MKSSFALPSIALALTLVGCRAPLQVDLAPDGKSVATASSSHVAINPVGEAAEVVIYRGESSAPKWSPDGDKIAFFGNGLVRIFDLRSRGTRVLPKGLGAPFAWSANGSELLTFNEEMRQMQTYHLASKEVVRTVDLPLLPLDIAVAKEGRGFAVASGETICVLREGSLVTVQALGSVMALAYTTEGLAWLTGVPLEGEVSQKVLLTEWNPATGLQENLELDLSILLNSEGKRVWPTSVQFSPQGDRVGILGLVDSSPAGVLDKLMQMEDQNSDEAESLNAQLRFTLAFATVENATGEMRHLQQFAGEAELFQWRQVAWSQDGQNVAIVSGENLKVLPGLR